jgi:hypothetical protein
MGYKKKNNQGQVYAFSVLARSPDRLHRFTRKMIDNRPAVDPPQPPPANLPGL